MSLVSPESSPSLSSQPAPTPLQPINQICQINLTSSIKPSVSSAFSIVPSSISLSSSSSLTSPASGASVVTKRRHSDAGFVFSSAIGKDSTESSELKSTTFNSIANREESVNGNELSSNEITLVDRLTKTTSIWFLPDIGRSSVANLLDEKEDGCFIVRNSSKFNSMALSVRLPEGKGPHVEHYLIETSPNGSFHLEGSENQFSSMASLISHYCNCCDELPVRLTLPVKLMNANFVKLTSYSLLGQEFWHTLNQTPKRTFAPIIRSASNISSSYRNNNNLSLHLSLSIKQLTNDSAKKPSIGTTLLSPENTSYKREKSNIKNSGNQLTNLSLITSNLNQQPYIVNELTSSGSSTNITCLASSSASSSASCSPPLTSSSSRIDTDELLNFNDEPIVDMKKSSTVPINLVEQCESSVKIAVPPKPPPRTGPGGIMQISIPPPIPSRTSKPSPKSDCKNHSSQSINSFIQSICIDDIFKSKNRSITSEEDELLIVNEEHDDDNDDDIEIIDIYPTNSSNRDVESNNNNIDRDDSLSISQRTSENGSSHNISSQNENKPEEMLSSHGKEEKAPRGIETLIKYYNSKVEDKYSDYEDIWSFAPKTYVDHTKTKQQESNCENESPITKASLPKTNMQKIEASIAPSDTFALSIASDSMSKCCSISTQTDPMKSSCDIDDQFNEIITRFEHHSHYGSDSNLTLSSIRSTKSKHNLSLESLIYLNKDALSIYGDPNDINFGRSEFNAVNPQLEDASTQAGKSKTAAQPAFKQICSQDQRRNIPGKTTANYGTQGGRDAWLVDSSWKWRRSNVVLDNPDDNCSNNDTDDTTLTLRSPLRRNKRSNQPDDKRTLDQERADLNRYRRFSARYVLESGVDSDPETNDYEPREERKSRTVEDLIAQEAPELRVPRIEVDTNVVSLDDSYDNVVTLRKHDKDAATRKANREDSSKTSGGTMTDTETVFSEPWDSEYWRKLISVTPGKTELLMSLSPEEDEKNSIYDEANGASTSNLLDSLKDSSSIGIESTSNEISKVKKEESCKTRIDKLVASFSSLSGSGGLQNSSILKDELGNRSDQVSDRESLSVDITEVTSFTSDTNSDLLSSISMHDQARISMESDSSTLIGYKSKTGTTVTSATSRNERIYTAGKSICDYIFKLAEENDNTFAKSVSHFIDCTKDLHEVNPHVVMRNIRQFMNGMKNYLVKHGEKNFLEMIREERNKLKSDEFLNIDAIIEGTLHKLIIKPLKSHLDGLFVEHYKQNGSLSLLSENMKNAQKRGPQEIGVRSDLYLPDSKSMAIIQKHFDKMQQAYSPLKKLEHLLAAISSIYSGVKNTGSGKRKVNMDGTHLSIGADDFLPIFIYVLVHCGFLSAEIEAEYMWGLLHPSLLSGEGGYYLTTLSSCLHVIKNMSENEISLLNQTCDDPNVTSSSTVLASSPSPQSTSPPATPSTTTGTSSSTSLVTSITPSRFASVTDLQGYMKIMIPNELSCSIVTKTLPVRPSMTTKDVCKMIAHKFNQTNSEDYGLFQITVDGSETQLEPNDLPQLIRSEAVKSGKLLSFAYKRIDVKFVWPKMDD
uniref:Protein sprint n=1 Tax=Tetranychus urticae TaxID=32264 RepID=T1K1D3_TETUR